MARKTNTREQRRPRTVVVGAGITEYWYLKHLKKYKGYKYLLRPSLFGDESMQTIKNRISEGLDTGASIVCVFDEDVSQWNESEKKLLEDIHRQYDSHKDVVIASSMPSIEYWMLLHYENTNRYFGTSAKVIELLKKHLVGFDKKEHYLRQDKWLISLLEDEKMQTAYRRAKEFGYNGESYSNMWKGIDKFEDSQ